MQLIPCQSRQLLLADGCGNLFFLVVAEIFQFNFIA